MNTNARIYGASLLALAACAVAGILAEPQALYASHFTVTLTAVSLLVVVNSRFPGLLGRSTSIALPVVLAVITTFTIAQAAAIAIAVVLLEELLHRDSRSDIAGLVYKLASMLLSVALAHHTYHNPHLFPEPGATAIRVLLAGSVLFIGSTFPSAAIAALSRSQSLCLIWLRDHSADASSALVGTIVAYVFDFATSRGGWLLGVATLPIAFLLFRLYTLSLTVLADRRRHAEQMANLHLRTIEALALAIEAKDTTTHDHLKRVQVYALELGRDLGLSPEELEALRAAALLHDIGKLAVPEYIISKPGRLTPEEFEKMKIHPVVGGEILQHVQFPYPVVPIVRSHHEKWNGTGYPDGLAGEAIPIGARILSAVDALDALATDRQYRRALPLDEAMSKIEAEAGKAFDPAVIAALKRRYRELERMAQNEHGIGLRLSTNLRIEAGEAPAAGFETQKQIVPALAESAKGDFLESVATVREDLDTIFGEISHPALGLDESLAVLAVRLKTIVPYDAVAIYFLRGDHLVPGYVLGDNYRLFSSLQIPVGQGLSGWVAENRKPILNGNPSVEPGYLNDPTVFSTLRSALAVPLEGSGDVMGVLALYQESANAFTRDHQRILESIAPKLALSIEHACRLEEEALEPESIAGLSDGLTFFSHLDNELQRCKRLNTPLTIVVCALDGLGDYHRRFGGHEAVRATHSIAYALKHECTNFDLVGRVGHTEFIVAMPGLTPEAAYDRASKLVHGASLRRNAGINVIYGCASYPEDGADAVHLLGVADRRLFAQRQQKNVDVPEAPVVSTPARQWLQ